MDLKDIDHERIKELISQRQGKNVIQNYVTIDLRERHVVMRSALVFLKDREEKYLKSGERTRETIKNLQKKISTIAELIECFWNEDYPNMNKFNIGKIVANMETYKPIILEALPAFIKALANDIESHPNPPTKLKDRLNTATQVLQDFEFLVQLEHPTSTPYLRQLVEVF